MSKETRIGAWIWRALAAVMIVLSAGLIVGLLAGIFSGSIWDISKYSRRIIYRDSQPLLFWIAVAFHAFVTAFIAYLTYVASTFAGFIQRNDRLERVALTVGHALDPTRKAPTWLVMVVFAGFFGFLYFMAAK